MLFFLDFLPTRENAPANHLELLKEWMILKYQISSIWQTYFRRQEMKSMHLCAQNHGTMHAHIDKYEHISCSKEKI